LQPGAGAVPQVQAPALQVAGPLGSFPQQWLESLPKQFGRVPVHVAPSVEASPEPSVEASPACESDTAASHWMHAMPRGVQAHVPFEHWSAAYLLPQQPLQMRGGVPGQVAESPEPSLAPASVTPASHWMHATPRGVHAHDPFKHWSAAYLLPQQPSQMDGGNPVHVAESLEASTGAFAPVSLVELQAGARREMRRKAIEFRIGMPWTKARRVPSASLQRADGNPPAISSVRLGKTTEWPRMPRHAHDRGAALAHDDACRVFVHSGRPLLLRESGQIETASAGRKGPALPGNGLATPEQDGNEDPGRARGASCVQELP
jgi:hypothetical protein